MKIDLTDKSLNEVVEYLQSKGYKPCKDSSVLDCPEGCGNYESTNECYEHEKYQIETYECFSCECIFYEILPSDENLLPDHWETEEGIMVGLEDIV